MDIKVFVVILTLMFTVDLLAKTTRNYDFDHKVHYSQKDLGKGQYIITITSNHETPFEQQATFIMRFAYKLCQRYGFTLTMMQGVEGFDDKKVSPNYIQPALTVQLTCPSS